jgi:ATP-dependent protease ClpP protease subunit
MWRKRNQGQVFNLHSPCKQRVAAAVALMLVLALECVELHAALLFRSAEQVNGQQRWSPIRKYSNASDTAYALVAANGAPMPAEEVRAFLSGEITPQDVDSAAVMANLVKDGKQKIAGNTVWLASDGGDIDAAMDLGRLLRKLRVFTLIGKDDQCLSACVFAFMGGERRSVTGRLGIHRPFLPVTQDTPDRTARYRHLETTLKDFIAELDFPASLYEAVMAVPPDSMQMVDPADLRRFYLEGISPLSEDKVDADSARRLGISMYDYLQRKARAPACAFFDAGEGRCEGRVQEAAASGSAADDPTAVQNAPSAGRTNERAPVDSQYPGTLRGSTRGARGS